MNVEKILFPEKYKTLFEFEKAVAAKTILVTGIDESSFLFAERYTIALAIVDITHFAFE